MHSYKKKKEKENLCPERALFSVTLVPNKVWGETWRVLEEMGHGLDEELFFPTLSRGGLSIEATSSFLFACAASFGNTDNDIAKQ